MKTQQPYNYILFVTLLAGWIPISQAQDVTTHSEASMFNVQFNPSAGTINWLTDWEIDSAASSFESSAGFDSAYDEDTDGDGETNASATSTVDIIASTDASTNTLTLNAYSDTEIVDASEVFVTNFSASTLYREFEITGGSGNVDVQFSYEYTAQLMGEAAENRQFEVDYTVIIEVSDGTNTWNITSTDKIEGKNTSITKNYGGVMSDTFTLTFGTPYYVILNVDPESGDGDEDPPLVELLDFKAEAVSGGIKLEWKTATENDNAGFHIWRSDEEDGKYIRITGSLIPAKGDGSTYTYIDKEVKDGVTYYYKLEDIDLFGVSTLRYPVSSSPAKVHLIGPAQNVVLTPDTPPRFEWTKGSYSEFKFQYSDDNGRTIHEIPSDKWMEETSFTPPLAAWKEYAQTRKGQIIFWRVVGKNGQGQAFSEVRSLTIE